jgi:MYXO-CTERM domain-containing protein
MRPVCALRVLTGRHCIVTLMRMRNEAWGRWVALGFAVWAFGEPVVKAEELCDGRVCPEMFTCETSTSTCAADDPHCVVFTETYCQSPECAEDSDCPAGRRCSRVEYEDCGSVPPGGSGGSSSVPPEECGPVTESWCHLAHDVECETSAQCGPGFTCRPIVDCDCTDPEAPVPPDCSCELAAIKGCYSPVVACSAETASTACASGWSCIENLNGVCNEIGDFHAGCKPGDPPMVCVPPGFSTLAPATTDGDAPEAGDGDTESSNAPPSTKGSGCSVAGAVGPGASTLLAMLGAALALARRRRRAPSPGATG